MRLTASLFTAAVLLTGTVAAAQLASPVAAHAATRATHATQATHAAVALGADEDTYSQNLLRDGWDPNEPGLSPAIVQGGSFGQLFKTAVNGQVYAQPLVVNNASAGTSSVIAATDNDWLYSLDGETGKINWSLSLGAPWPASVTGCGDIVPEIGITSTPVYDPATGTLYAVAVVNDGPSLYQPDIYLYAITEKTGAVQWRVPIKGSPVNDPTRPFNPLTERQRASLLLLNGSIYMAFASYCDYSPYAGYVVGVNTTSRAQTMWTDEAGLTDTQSGIWMGGSGLMSDGKSIFFVTGNGVSPAPGPGTTPPAELGDSVVRLGVQTGGALAAQDFFSPANASTLDVTDQDYGSGGAVGLPFGTSTYPHLLVAAGKDGRLFMLDRDALGGRETGSGGADNPVSMSGPYGAEVGRPAAFAGANGADYVYYAGVNDNLRALQFNAASPAAPTLTDAANSTARFGGSSGSPAVTSNGTDPSSAVVWMVYSQSEAGGTGMLEAFDGAPQQGGTLPEIWSAPIGTPTQFTVPATANGRVYVGTRDGFVFAYGSPDKAPVTAPSTTFGRITAGKAATATVTVTATTTVTIKGVSVTGADHALFQAQTPTKSGASVKFPVALSAGQTLKVPVTFKPASPGGFTAWLAISTGTANFGTVTVPLTGNGTRTGLYSSATVMNFRTVAVSLSRSYVTDIINGGTSAQKVSSVVGATASWGIRGIVKNQVIPPGGSVPVTVTFKPTAAAPTATHKMFISGAGGGTIATTSLIGTSVAGQGALTTSAPLYRLGGVHLGQSSSVTMTLTDTGNLPVTVTKFTAPAVPFGTPTPVMTGLTVAPGFSIQVPVTFTPQSTGTVGDAYQITYRDGLTPPRTLIMHVIGTGIAPTAGVAVPSPGGGWTFNGSAQMTGSILRLTPATPNRAGSAVYYEPVASSGLRANFTAQLSGGTGGDGMTFALLDPAHSTVTSLGASGSRRGFGGVTGVAVVLGTNQDPGDPSANFVGIATGVANGKFVWAATSTGVPNLRTGTPRVSVAVAGGKISVSVNGTQYLHAAVTLPAVVRPAFTAGTGTANDDIQAVSAVSVSSGTVTVPPPGGGWSFNGSALMSGSDTSLTQAAASQAGSVVYPTAVASAALQVRFNIQIGGGSGGEGMTFALLTPPATATSLGANGQGLGFSGLSGIAVSFNTFARGQNPSANFAAIEIGANGTAVIQQQAQEIGLLRAGTHQVTVVVKQGSLVVLLDGEQVLAQKESLPSSVVLAYTAGTDTNTDAHLVRDVAISAASFG